MRTAGELWKVAEQLRDIQKYLDGDGPLWLVRVELAAVAAKIEQELGARDVRERRAQSMGNAA